MGEDSGSDEGDFILCDTCDIVFRSVRNYAEHRRGSKHLKKEKTRRNKNLSKTSADEGGATVEVAADDTGDGDQIECKICDKEFSGILPFKQHLKSGPHAKAMKRQRILSEITKPESTDDVLAESGDDLDDEDLVPKPFASCQTCKKVFSGPESYRDHLISKQHRKKVKEAKYLKLLKESNILPGKEEKEEEKEPIVEPAAIGSEGQIEILKKQLLQTAESTLSNDEDQPDKTFSCEQCGKYFSGPASLLQHLISKIHKKKLKQMKLWAELKAKTVLRDEQTDEETTSEEEDDDEAEVLACMTCGVSFSGPESMMAHLKSKTHKKKTAFKKARSHVMESVSRRRPTEPKDEEHATPTDDKDSKVRDVAGNEQETGELKPSLAASTDSDVVGGKSSGLFSQDVRDSKSNDPASNRKEMIKPDRSFQMHGNPDDVDRDISHKWVTDPRREVKRADINFYEKNGDETTVSSNPSAFQNDPENSASDLDDAKQNKVAVKKRTRSNLEKMAGAVVEIMEEI